MSKAIILAAGVGSRIKKFHDKPKTLLNFPDSEKTILERIINILNSNNYKKIVIVTGFKNSLIKKKITGKNIKFINFHNYKNTNNLQTLLHVKKELNSNILCLFADIIFDEKIIKLISKSKKKITLGIDTSKVLSDTMRIKKKFNKINGIGSHITIKEGDGNFIGIAKFSKKGALMLKRYLSDQSDNKKDYYTIVLNKMISDKVQINFIDFKKYFWKEIDTIKDYNIMKKIIRNKHFKF